MMNKILVISLVFFIQTSFGILGTLNDVKVNHVFPTTIEQMFIQMEKKYEIPSGLLKAISIIESGRRKKNQKNRIEICPWAINTGGKTFIFHSKMEAIAKVKELQRRGIKNIDVGCMQINLFHHSNAFNSLHDAFDPQQNMEYAAKFLKSLKTRFGSWKKAVCYYHSQNSKYYRPYYASVIREYNRLPKMEYGDNKLAIYLCNKKTVDTFNKHNQIEKEISDRLHKLGQMTLARGTPRFALLLEK